MLTRSEAIILKRTPYSDNSAILKVLTRTHGLQSFMVRGLHGKSGKTALYQPGSLLEIVFYNQENKSLKTIKECQLLAGNSGIPTDPLRLHMMIFCIEVAGKCLAEGDFDEEIFLFLQNHLQEINTTNQMAFMPMKFILNFTAILGFGLNNSDYTTKYSSILLDSDEMSICELVKKGTYPELHLPERRRIMDKLLNHLKLHLSMAGDFKSYKVLTELFD